VFDDAGHAQQHPPSIGEKRRADLASYRSLPHERWHMELF
jgi:hypothetical protein